MILSKEAKSCKLYRLTLCCKFSWIWIKSDADCCKLRDAQNGLLFRDSKVLCAWCHLTHHYCPEISEKLLQKHKSISKSAQKIESKNSSYGTMPKFTGSGKKHISQQFPKIFSQNKFKQWHIIVRWALVFYLSHGRFNKRCLLSAIVPLTVSFHIFYSITPSYLDQTDHASSALARSLSCRCRELRHS